MWVWSHLDATEWICGYLVFVVTTGISFFRISALILTCVVKAPGICCGRHWWDGERWCPTVRLQEFALVRHLRGGCWLSVRLSSCGCGGSLCSTSQCKLEGSDSVELHPRQTAYKAWGVVVLNEERVYLSSFCVKMHQRWMQNIFSATLNSMLITLGSKQFESKPMRREENGQRRGWGWERKRRERAEEEHAMTSKVMLQAE